MWQVWLGHSSDVAHYVQRRFGQRSVAMLFMDHRGSLFHEDLETFEELGLFKEGAMVVADNVLKPGAPDFLWQVRHAYETKLLKVPEFGLGHQVLHDWVAVCRSKPYLHKPPTPPEGLHALARQCDALRRRSLKGQLSSEARKSFKHFKSLRLKTYFLDIFRDIQ